MKLLFAITLALYTVDGFHLKNFVPAPQIIGGLNATRGQFPYMVSLQYRSSGSQYHNCGGAIIAKGWVVTAAHCFYSANNIVAVAGVLSLSEQHPDNQIIPVVEVIRHPKYSGNQNDISLMKLEHELVFSENVQPIPLSKLKEEFIDDVIVSGWGRNNVPNLDTLQYLSMPTISVKECNERFESIGNYPFKIVQTHICALPKSVGKSGCHGDSGGPLVRDTENGKVLVGVVHGGDSGCGQNIKVSSPNVFTKVSHFIDFIETYVDLP